MQVPLSVLTNPTKSQFFIDWREDLINPPRLCWFRSGISPEAIIKTPRGVRHVMNATDGSKICMHNSGFWFNAKYDIYQDVISKEYFGPIFKQFLIRHLGNIPLIEIALLNRESGGQGYRIELGLFNATRIEELLRLCNSQHGITIYDSGDGHAYYPRSGGNSHPCYKIFTASCQDKNYKNKYAVLQERK